MAKALGSALKPLASAGRALVAPVATQDSGYFNSAGKPTFANSPQVTGLDTTTPTGTAAPTQSVTTTVTPPPPDLSGSKWQAYLTPDQLNALGQARATYGENLGNETASSGIQLDANGNPVTDSSGNPVLSNSGTDEINYASTVQNAQYAHDVNTAQSNEELAARGLFDSSIRANDLTDLNRTLATTQATATATLNTLVGEATRAITALNGGWASTQLGYQGDAAQNAAAAPAQQPYQQTTQVPATPPAQPALAPAPAVIQPPVPAGPGSPQPRTSSGGQNAWSNVLGGAKLGTASAGKAGAVLAGNRLAAPARGARS